MSDQLTADAATKQHPTNIKCPEQ